MGCTSTRSTRRSPAPGRGGWSSGARRAARVAECGRSSRPCCCRRRRRWSPWSPTVRWPAGGCERPTGVLTGLNRSSQHRLVELSVGALRGPRRESSSRASCGALRSAPQRRLRPRFGSIATSRCPWGSTEPPWFGWRLQTVETRMESCRRTRHPGSRRRVGTPRRRRPRR